MKKLSLKLVLLITSLSICASSLFGSMSNTAQTVQSDSASINAVDEKKVSKEEKVFALKKPLKRSFASNSLNTLPEFASPTDNDENSNLFNSTMALITTNTTPTTTNPSVTLSTSSLTSIQPTQSVLTLHHDIIEVQPSPQSSPDITSMTTSPISVSISPTESLELTIDSIRNLAKTLPFVLSDYSDTAIADFYNNLKKNNDLLCIYKNFTPTVTKFLATMKQYMNDEKLWVGTKPQALFDNNDDTSKKSTFIPFVQKITLNPESQVVLWGDTHGAFHSTYEKLKNMHVNGFISTDLILPSNVYLILLGDMVDRGLYSIETLWLLMELKIRNPNQVFMLRGNHEDFETNKTYGLVRELCKIAPSTPLQKDIDETYKPMFEAIYNLLPVALIINNSMLCCHASPDWCHNPQNLLASKNPIAFECLTKQNYNPAWFTKQLSDDCLWNLVYDITELEIDRPDYRFTQVATQIVAIADAINTSCKNTILKINPLAQQIFSLKQSTSSNTTAQTTQNEIDSKESKSSISNTIATHNNLTTSLNKSLKNYLQAREKLTQYIERNECNIDPRPLLQSYKDVQRILNNIQLKTESILYNLRQQTCNQDKINALVEDTKNIDKQYKDFQELGASNIASLQKIDALQTVLFNYFKGTKNIDKILKEQNIKLQEHPATFGINMPLYQLFTSKLNFDIKDLIPDTLSYIFGDIIVDNPNRALLCANTYAVEDRFGQNRTALGSAIITQLLKAQGLKCVFRGHQQYDNIRACLDENMGLYLLDDDQETFAQPDSIKLQPLGIYTLDIAASAQAPLHPFDSYALVTIKENFDQCTIENVIIINNASTLSDTKEAVESSNATDIDKESKTPSTIPATTTETQPTITTASTMTPITTQTAPTTTEPTVQTPPTTSSTQPTTTTEQKTS